MGDKVSPHTGKIIPRFFDILLTHGYGHILILHNGVCPCRLVEQHLVIFLAVLIQAVIDGFTVPHCHRDKDGLLKIRLVQAAVVDGDFCGRPAVEGVEQLRVFKEHCLLVLTARHGIVDVLKLKGLCILVLSDKENPVLPDGFHGDDRLYRFRHGKFFLVLLEQVSKRFYHVLPPYAFLISLLSFFLVSPPCVSASGSGRASPFPLLRYSASTLHSRGCLAQTKSSSALGTPI